MTGKRFYSEPDQANINSVSEEKRSDLIHISEIDEYLAVRTAEAGGRVLSFHVEKTGDDGFIELTDREESMALDEAPVDFELSPSEYLNLADRELEDLFLSPLVTSSALELFDFLLLSMEGFNCAAEFTGSAWKIRITEPI